MVSIHMNPGGTVSTYVDVSGFRTPTLASLLVLPTLTIALLTLLFVESIRERAEHIYAWLVLGVVASPIVGGHYITVRVGSIILAYTRQDGFDRHLVYPQRRRGARWVDRRLVDCNPSGYQGRPET